MCLLVQVLAGSVVGATGEEKEGTEETDSKPPPTSNDSSNRYTHTHTHTHTHGVEEV